MIESKEGCMWGINHARDRNKSRKYHHMMALEILNVLKDYKHLGFQTKQVKIQEHTLHSEYWLHQHNANN